MSNPSTRKKPSLEQWEALYEVAGGLKQMAPWRVLSDTNILVLHLPGRQEPVYCSIMGQGDMTYGIGVYPDNESYARLMRIIDQDAYSPELLMLEQNCLMCNFGDREEIEPEDREVIKALGLRFRGRGQWIYFRSTHPGQFPWYMDAEEAELLTAALQNLYMLCKGYLEGKLPVDFEAGKTLARWYDPEKEMWMNAVVPMKRPKMERTLTLQDDLLLARLKKGKKTSVRLEIESFYLPVPVQEDRNSPPTGVHMTLLVDRDTGAVLGQHIGEPGEQDYAAGASVLLDYIEECGRPAAVYARSAWEGDLLRNTCKSIGVRLVEDEGVPAIDGLLEQMLSGFMMGDELF